MPFSLTCYTQRPQCPPPGLGVFSSLGVDEETLKRTMPVRKGKFRVRSTFRSLLVVSLTGVIVISALFDELNQLNFGVIVQKIGTYQAVQDKTPKIPTLGYLEPITAVVLTAGDRMEALNTILGFYLNKTAQLVPEVKLLWNGGQEVKLNSEFERNERLTLYVEEHNTLNNRYRHWHSIKTSAVLLLDDDCIVRDIEKAITVYMRNTERIVSFYARTHKYDHHEKLWKYAHPRSTNGRYSLGTGQASLLATHWLKDFYTDPKLENIRRFIDNNRPTCEDIALHMYVSNQTKLSPVLVRAGQQQLRGSSTGMSSAREWGHKRKACLNFFISTPFGGQNPLVHSDMASPL